MLNISKEPSHSKWQKLIQASLNLNQKNCLLSKFGDSIIFPAGPSCSSDAVGTLSCLSCIAVGSAFFCTSFTLRKLYPQEARWPLTTFSGPTAAQGPRRRRVSPPPESHKQPQNGSPGPGFAVCPTLNQPRGNETRHLDSSAAPAHSNIRLDSAPPELHRSGEERVVSQEQIKFC